MNDWFEKCFLASAPKTPGWFLLHEKAIIKTIPAKSCVFSQGNACDHFAIVTSGHLRIQYEDTKGNEITLHRLSAAEICITTTLCLLSDGNYPNSAYAETDLTMATISKEDFNQAIEDIEFRNYIFSHVAKHSLDLLDRINEIIFLTVEERLIRYLINNGPCIKATHQEIAIELGTAREVVTRNLKRLTKDGYIKTNRKEISVIDKNSLKSCFKHKVFPEAQNI